MQPRHGRQMAILSLGLVVTLAITALTRRNAPVLIWFVVIGFAFIFGIGREWFIVTKRLRSKKRTSFQILSLLLGSYPYGAAMIVMFIFTYCVLKSLLGYQLDTYELRTMGKIVAFAIAGIFFGGFFISILGIAMNLIRGRKREPITDRRKRKATSEGATQQIVRPERGERIP